jgi:hypothetical protein
LNQGKLPPLAVLRSPAKKAFRATSKDGEYRICGRPVPTRTSPMVEKLLSDIGFVKTRNENPERHGWRFDGGFVSSL